MSNGYPQVALCGRRWRPNQESRESFNTLAEHAATALADKDAVRRYLSEHPDAEEPAAAEEVDTAAVVREHIDAHAPGVRACTGGGGVAVEAVWAAGGVVEFRVHGEDDDAVNDCVAAAVGALNVATRTPGRVLHPVTER